MRRTEGAQDQPVTPFNRLEFNEDLRRKNLKWVNLTKDQLGVLADLPERPKIVAYTGCEANAKLAPE
jgi:hypothetical protein